MNIKHVCEVQSANDDNIGRKLSNQCTKDNNLNNVLKLHSFIQFNMVKARYEIQ